VGVKPRRDVVKGILNAKKSEIKFENMKKKPYANGICTPCISTGVIPHITAGRQKMDTIDIRQVYNGTIPTRWQQQL